MNNSTNKHRPNALADRIAGLDDPSMGDERERDVILRAYTFGSVLSIYVFMAIGVLFAVIGAGVWSALPILASGVSGAAVSIYCRREGLDFSLATARVAPKRLVTHYLIGAAFAASWVLATIFHQTTGYPLIDAKLGSTLGSSDGDSSIAIGAVVGGLTAISVITLQRHRRLKRARLEAARANDIADED